MRTLPLIMEEGLLVARQTPENPFVVELLLDGNPVLTMSLDNLDALASYRARMGPRETNERSEFTEREAHALRMWYDQVKENRRLVHALIAQEHPKLDSNQLRAVFRHYAGGNISLGKAIETVNEWLAGAEVGKLPAHELLNEPLFVLRAQDVTAPHAVDAWCSMAELAGADEFTLHGARIIAEEMRLWQEAHHERVKVPDREPDAPDSPLGEHASPDPQDAEELQPDRTDGDENA